jgi:hypothetical protein
MRRTALTPGVTGFVDKAGQLGELPVQKATNRVVPDPQDRQSARSSARRAR